MGWHSKGGGQKITLHLLVVAWSFKKKDSPYFGTFPEPGCDYGNGFKRVQPTLYIYHRTDFWKTGLGNDICIQRIESFGIHPGLSVHLDFQ